jgi:hypothetical protein
MTVKPGIARTEALCRQYKNFTGSDVPIADK